MQFVTQNGYLVEIDKADYNKIKHLAWYGQKFSNTTYVMASIDGRNVRLHRYILDAPQGRVVDHINGDGLDNRRKNIRLCTQSENLRNKVNLSTINTTGHSGVYRTAEGKWCSTIILDNRTYSIGICETLEDAGIARRIGELFLYGEFAPKISRVDIPDAQLLLLGFILAGLHGQLRQGVSQKENGRWAAYLNKKHIGMFGTREEALAARQHAEIHGVPVRPKRELNVARLEREKRVAERKRIAAEREARRAYYLSLREMPIPDQDLFAFLD